MGRNVRGAEVIDARAVATYLVALKGVLMAATESRQVWVKKIGALMADTRHGNPALISQQAGQIGRDHGAAFRDAERSLERLKPPRECDGCHKELSRWLAKLIAACDVLSDIGKTGALGRLRETQTLLGDGRRHAESFNEEYARMCAALREHVSEVKARQATKRVVKQPAGA